MDHSSVSMSLCNPGLDDYSVNSALQDLDYEMTQPPDVRSESYHIKNIIKFFSENIKGKEIFRSLAQNCGFTDHNMNSYQIAHNDTRGKNYNTIDIAIEGIGTEIDLLLANVDVNAISSQVSDLRELCNEVLKVDTKVDGKLKELANTATEELVKMENEEKAFKDAWKVKMNDMFQDVKGLIERQKAIMEKLEITSEIDI
jgi:hypothetical protein